MERGFMFSVGLLQRVERYLASYRKKSNNTQHMAESMLEHNRDPSRCGGRIEPHPFVSWRSARRFYPRVFSSFSLALLVCLRHARSWRGFVEHSPPAPASRRSFHEAFAADLPPPAQRPATSVCPCAGGGYRSAAHLTPVGLPLLRGCPRPVVRCFFFPRPTLKVYDYQRRIGLIETSMDQLPRG